MIILEPSINLTGTIYIQCNFHYVRLWRFSYKKIWFFSTLRIILHSFKLTSKLNPWDMANVSVFLSDLQTGRSSSSVEVRLLRFWETRNVRHDGELMGVDMLLLDSRKYLIKLHLLFISIVFDRFSSLAISTIWICEISFWKVLFINRVIFPV